MIKKESFVTFKIGNEFFGISVYRVLEVLHRQEINLIPEAPRFILGVINFRGDIIPVLNMHERFGIDSSNGSQETILVLEPNINDQKYLLGIRADKVVDVIEITENNIKNVQEAGLKYKPDYVNGVIQYDDEFVILLETDKVFSLSELIDLNNISDLRE